MEEQKAGCIFCMALTFLNLEEACLGMLFTLTRNLVTYGKFVSLSIQLIEPMLCGLSWRTHLVFYGLWHIFLAFIMTMGFRKSDCN